MRASNEPSTLPPANGTDEGGTLDFGTYSSSLIKSLSEYADAQKRYLQLIITERIGLMLAGTVNVMVMAVSVGTMLLFFNVALAFYLGDVFGSRSLGFLVVGGIYLLLFGGFSLWWKTAGRERFILARMKDMNPDNDHEEHRQPR